MSCSWECGECGGVVDGEGRPERCLECGTAGTFFPSEPDERHVLHEEDTMLHIAWLRAIHEANGRKKRSRQSGDSGGSLP